MQRYIYHSIGGFNPLIDMVEFSHQFQYLIFYYFFCPV